MYVTQCKCPRCTRRFMLTAVPGVVLVLSFFLTNAAYAEESKVDETEEIIYIEDVDTSTGNFSRYTNNETSTPDTTIEEIINDSLLDATGGLCSFTMHGDYPHVSKNNRDVSIHGWWDVNPGSQNCPEYADVEVWLKVNWCDIFGNCMWVTLDNNTNRVRAGGGSGHRTNARYECASEDVIGYQNVVDVDLEGVPDLPNKLKTTRNVKCCPNYP